MGLSAAGIRSTMLAIIAVALVWSNLACADGEPDGFVRDPAEGEKLFEKGRAVFAQAGAAPAAQYRELLREALQHFTLARRHRPHDWGIALGKAIAHVGLGDVENALPLLDFAESKVPASETGDRANIQVYRGTAYLQLCEKDKAIAAFDKALEIEPQWWPALIHQTDIALLTGDPAKARTHAERAIAISNGAAPRPFFELAFAHAAGGQTKLAIEVLDKLAAGADPGAARDARLVIARLHAQNEGKPGHGIALAEKQFAEVAAQAPIAASAQYAMYLTQVGRHAEALEQWEARARIGEKPEFLLSYGASLLGVGRTDAGRAVLTTACRWNPRHLERVRKMTGGAAVAGQISRVLADLAGRTGKDALRVLEDADGLGPRVRALDGLAASHHFDAAATGYRGFAGWARAGSLAAVLADRIVACERGKVLFTRLAQAITAGKAGAVELEVAGQKVKPIGGDVRRFRFRLGSGEAWLPWRTVPPARLVALCESVAPTPEERFALGALCWFNDGQAAAISQFLRAKSDAKAAPLVDRFLAHARGVALPAKGFVVQGDALVTDEEQKLLAAGKLSFRGQWVTPDERAKLLGGQVQSDGKWLKQTPDELRARGLVERDGKWWLPDELEPTAARWEDGAKTRDTAHFAIVTDLSPSMAAVAATALEATRARIEAVLDTVPDSKIRVLAFARRGDYQAYLGRFDTPAHAFAADALGGMAGVEPKTAAVFAPRGDASRCLDAITGVVARQLAQDAVGERAPAWLLAGLAGHCGGCQVSGDVASWADLPRARVAFLRRMVVQKELYSLAELVAIDPGALEDPRQRDRFEAQSWALVRFLTTSIDPSHRLALTRHLEQVKTGPASLAQAFGDDLPLVEAAFRFFVEDLF